SQSIPCQREKLRTAICEFLPSRDMHDITDILHKLYVHAQSAKSNESLLSSVTCISQDISSSSGTLCAFAENKASWFKDVGRRRILQFAIRWESRRSIRSRWICSSSDFCPKSGASGPTLISTCPVGISGSE